MEIKDTAKKLKELMKSSKKVLLILFSITPVIHICVTCVIQRRDSNEVRDILRGLKREGKREGIEVLWDRESRGVKSGRSTVIRA